MRFIVIGISHKTANLEVREKFYLSKLERLALLSQLKNQPSVAGAIILSTCNRTEVYADLIDDETQGEVLFDLLFKIKRFCLTSELRKYFYIYSEEECIRHLLCVATGLDSKVLGERQILGQVKNAIELSRSGGILSKEFNLLSGIAIRAGKKAQNETEISFGGVSVSWAAVNTAEETLGTLYNKSVLIIGAGKMSELTAGQLRSKNVGSVYIINRSKEKALLLAGQFGGEAVSYFQLKEILSNIDICICCASAPHYLIDKDSLESIMNSRVDRGLLCIDISMPRNIDPAVAQIKGVTILTIDNLDKVVSRTLDKRRRAIEQVNGIIEKKICEFNKKQENRLLLASQAAQCK